MKKTFCLQNSKFVYTKDELGYQEVLDDFRNSRNITIITFNISLNKSDLITCLKQAPVSSEIKIVTNIPQRWNTYRDQHFKSLAAKQIKLYLTKLKPESIGGKVSTFFNFNNHGKIIMTDRLAYIGSENYTEESAKNFEFGVIVEDKDFIKFLTDEVMPDVEKNSTPYYSFKHMPLILKMEMAISALFSSRNELFDEIYLWDGHRGRTTYIYNTGYDLLSWSVLESIEFLMNDIDDIIDELLANIDNNGISDIISKYKDKLTIISTSYSQKIQLESVCDLANFSHENYSLDLLQEKYAMEADEEHLEECIQKCEDAAWDKLELLCNDAKEDLDRVISDIDKYIKTMNNCAELFQKNDRVVNPAIDNSLQ